MNEFERDDEFQRVVRDHLLKPFYARHSHEGRFVFADKGQLSTILQRELSVDTVMQVPGNKLVGVEEKIVRWKGRVYSAYTLETISCTIPGRERKGWMYTARCDVLMYCFGQEDESLLIHAIAFPPLQRWFFENDRYLQYAATRTDQINQTECRVVPIADVWGGLRGCRAYHLTGPVGEVELQRPLDSRTR